MSSPDYISLADIAARLGVCRRTVRRWHDAGKLPAPVRLPGVLRWEEKDIMRWIRSSKKRTNEGEQ